MKDRKLEVWERVGESVKEDELKNNRIVVWEDKIKKITKRSRQNDESRNMMKLVKSVKCEEVDNVRIRIRGW